MSKDVMSHSVPLVIVSSASLDPTNLAFKTVSIKRRSDCGISIGDSKDPSQAERSIARIDPNSCNRGAVMLYGGFLEVVPGSHTC